MESRIQILDRLAIKFGKKDNISSFEEFVRFYESSAVTMLVYQAMIVHSRQEQKLAVCRTKINFNRQLLGDLEKIKSGELYDFDLYDKTYQVLMELEKEEEQIEGNGDKIIKES
jgi:hypothetical protein